MTKKPGDSAEVEAAYDDEVAAFRAASVRVLEPYLAELLRRGGLVRLARSEHHHATLVMDTNGKAMWLRVKIEFGDVVDQKELVELIAVAQSTPGKVAES